MDPVIALRRALEGDRQAARDFTDWSRSGGFRPRVELSPSLDLWMRGVRYATADTFGSRYLHVTDDAGRRHTIRPEHILRVLED